MDELSSGQRIWFELTGRHEPNIDDDKLWENIERFFLGSNCPPTLTMRDRYVKVLRLRFGKDGQRMTLRSIGEVTEDDQGNIGITSERVRQLIKGALGVLRQHALDDLSTACIKQTRGDSW